jgi:OmpA-OmpF porin, OOP family
MRCRIESAVLFFLLIVTGNKLFAQTDTTHHGKNPVKVYLDNSSFRTWSVGVSGGISTPYTLIGYNSRQDFTSPDVQIGYGIYIKDQLSNSFGLQADLMAGKLRADHSYQTFPSGQFIYTQSDTRLNWSASVSGNFTIVHLGIVQPYLTLGGGVASYSAALHAAHAGETVPAQGTLSSFFVPLGLGLKFNITRGINIDLGYQVNFVMADNFDGYNYGPTNDRFSYSHVGLEFALGKHSKQQLAAQRVAIRVRNRWLVREQALKDSIRREQGDFSVEKASNEKLKNDLDAANANLASLTADSDGDGVPDKYDKCPGTPADAKVDVSGCPLPVTVAGIKSEISDEDKRIAGIAAGSVEFYTGTEIISGRSFPNLNAVVKLLTEKKLSLKVDAYTNKAGNSSSDTALAKLRAEAVKNYLVNKGANGSKIQVEGHSGFAPEINASARRRQSNAGLIQLTLAP